MEKSKKRESKNRLVLIITVLIVLVLLVGIALKTFPTNGQSDVATDGSEVVISETNEVIKNTSNIEKLKSSEYTSSGFDNIKIGDTMEIVEENIGTLEQLDVESEYDTYVYKDEELGSNYVFYFSNNELKEVSVFLVQ